MRTLIDWELLNELQSSSMISKPDMWDAFATRYDGYTKLQGTYTEKQLDLMQLSASDSVLDVGAGPGRVSIAAARRVKSVTALDVSRGMLDMLEKNVREAGVTNVTPVHLGWDAVVPHDNVQPHDIVIAARSPATKDLVKLDALARKAVYVLLFCGPSLKQFHDTLLEGIEYFPSAGGPHSAIAGHAMIFNRLIAMGKEAHVTYIDDGFYQRYADLDAAVADFTWLNLPEGSLPRFKNNLAPYIRPCDDGGVELTMTTRTAVVWWYTHNAG
jgi:SAM-dependent methyltransferase